jgi:thiol:disulfide interchange protein
LKNAIKVFLLVMLSLLSAVTASAHADSSLDDPPEYSVVYDPTRDPFADGSAALELARATGRRVLIEVGGDWCSWCHVLSKFLDENPGVRKRMYEVFVVLKVNFSDENPNSDFLQRFPEPIGYPHLYVADNDGAVLHSQTTAAFLQDGGYSAERWMKFFDQWGMKR